MLAHSKSKKPEVTVNKGDTPKESLTKGIDRLGNLSKFINDGDQVFIKFNLKLPSGFPTNTNFDILETLIVSCKEVGVKKIYLGSFPFKGVPIKVISDLLDLKGYFNTLGAELAFLDNSDDFDKKEINQDQLKRIKYNSLEKVNINDKEFLIPKIVLNSDKFIIVNQINVNPLFQFNSSLLNSYSIIAPKDQEIGKDKPVSKEYITFDQYKKDLISDILDVFMIKQPHLVINDLFYILEGAGPYIYKDSNLKKTGLIVIGDDMIAVDLITMQLLNLEINDSELIVEARNKNITIPQFSDIKVLGEKIEEVRTDVVLCASNLEDVQVRNFSIKSGKFCSGCFNQAYNLLNLMKTYMGKDLKYNIHNSFLIGENPTEPDNIGNIIVFGDCAVNSTKNYNFRTIIVEPKKKSKGKGKNKLLKEKHVEKKTSIKEKSNKDILELPGCPPDILNCLELIIKYYGKKNVPNLNLFMNVNQFWIMGDLNDKLKIWEKL
ncbi:MAG: DUF362 domain-containing protein [Promethearchaeota archaeon]|nr:MAG: DUF362 domain-containing protein [Candidatus Lokiarchaeota archaeon]